MLLALAVESKERVAVQGKRKLILVSVQTSCDHDFVEYFRQVPNQDILYTFRVVKTAPSFTITIIMRNVKSQRIMYKIKNLDGCEFLKNQLMNKVLSRTYRALLVNNTFFKCPIEPKVYFLKNLTEAMIVPSIHPAGYYQLSMRVQMSQSSAPFVMEILWKYKIVFFK
ncbi:uncharacterized protein Dvir_GJ11719 [Drosophila virilis]|uniref:MD-2-related lipid-recognition domain-containing protein n=1 Tax=Drosophila virilis TaxID=7244 RepID=B4LEI1_DROVI|nr:uncharacterized protein LOC6623767 [Drosophila virilis]EDW70157.2 uncharacterized protein Dvir_GJ11719 [Drosophila virilis]